MGRLGKAIYGAGVLSGLLLAGCAGFAFKYYGLDGVRYEDGKLLGPTADKDLPFSACAPTAGDKHPCAVMFAKEFFAFKQDYGDCKNQLKDCQSNCKP